MALTRLAHQLIRDYFADRAKTVAVDGTCGNGHDTEFLARLGFNTVLGFDVQAQAIANTRRRLEQSNLDNATLYQVGHEDLTRSHLIAAGYQSLDCAMFNFGYLPKADKTITTLAPTSLIALQQALVLLSQHGMISLMCYPGHEEGAVETKAIQHCLSALPPTWQVTEHLANSPTPQAPILYVITPRNN